MKLLKENITLTLLLSLFACGGGGGSSSDIDFDEDFDSEVKPFFLADLSIASNHVKTPSKVILAGLVPSVSSDGITTIILNRPVNNGWAKRYLNVYIKDTNLISGRYDCLSANDTHNKPTLANRDCYIRYENDSYMGIFETWASDINQNCSVTVIDAKMDDVVSNRYQDINLSVSCSNMQHIWEQEEFKQFQQIPEDADLVSTVTLQGTIKNSKDSPLQGIEKVIQTSEVSLSASGGSDIIGQNVNFTASVSGPAYTIAHQFIYLESTLGDYDLEIYINAAYDIEGVFTCTNPPTFLGDPVRIDNGECLISLTKRDSSNIYDYTWDSQAGSSCFINVTNASNNTSSAPWYNVTANINCPGMVSRAITYDLGYPITPSNINISGILKSI